MAVIIYDHELIIYENKQAVILPYKKEWIIVHKVEDKYAHSGFILVFNYETLLLKIQKPITTYVVDHRTSY